MQGNSNLGHFFKIVVISAVVSLILKFFSLSALGCLILIACALFAYNF